MVNKVILLGKLGKDPEFKTTQSGMSLAKFSLATTEKRKNQQGELQESTEWHRITCWERQAEIARDYLRKGSKVYLEGRIHYDSYENKEGHKVYTTDIIAHTFQMLSGRQESPQGQQQAPQERAPGPVAGTNNEKRYGYDSSDLPF